MVQGWTCFHQAGFAGYLASTAADQLSLDSMSSTYLNIGRLGLGGEY